MLIGGRRGFSKNPTGATVQIPNNEYVNSGSAAGKLITTPMRLVTVGARLHARLRPILQ